MADTAVAWSVNLDLHIDFADAGLLSANDTHLKREAGYVGTLWVSMMRGPDAPVPVRITFARGGEAAPTTLKPTGYAVLMSGSERAKTDTPWPAGGLQLAGRNRGIPTAACVELVLLNDVASHDNRLARDTIGSASLPLQQLASIDSRAAPYQIECPIVLRATQEPSICKLRATVTNARFDRARLHEVYDAAMQPHVQAGIMHYHSSLGWVHMVRNDAETGATINPLALVPLTDVASKSIVPFVNDGPGVLPVDFFFDIHNPAHYPVVSEQRWLRIAEHAFWLRGLSLDEVHQLLCANLDREHYEPRFEAVMSGFGKLFVLTANSMPYRSDEMRVRNAVGEVIRSGTDDFRSALTQLCGDCEDLAKCAYEMFTMFSAGKFQSPVLCNLQRLASCYLPAGGLFDVTSAKLEQDEPSGDTEANASAQKPPAHKYVPVGQRKCGLHAATFLYPKAQFKTELARTTSAEQAAGLNLRGTSVVPEAEMPALAANVGMIVLEGTGAMDSRMLNHREYVVRAARAQDTSAAMAEAEKLATAEEMRLLVTRKVYVENISHLGPFGFKPEMGAWDRYEYDYDKLWTGELAPLSKFYVAGVELFTTVPLKAGQRYCRFAFVTQKQEWLKTCMFEAIVAGDACVALMPQPPITEAVYKCASMMKERLEPVPFVDAHVDDAGPDVLLAQAETTFGRAAGAATPDGLTRVDLLLYNHSLDAHELASQLPALKQHLASLPYVRSMCYRNMDLNAGLVTGVLRIFVDARAALEYKPPPVGAAIAAPTTLPAEASVFGGVRRHISAKYGGMEWTLRSISRKNLPLGGDDTLLCPDDASFMPVNMKVPEDDAVGVVEYFAVRGLRATALTIGLVRTDTWRYLGTMDDKKTHLLGHYTSDGKLFEKWSVRDVLRYRDAKLPVLLGVHLEEYNADFGTGVRHARVRTLDAKRV